MQRILNKNPLPKELTNSTTAYPFYMIDLSKANWDIYVTNKELLSFTEHQLTGKGKQFQALFPNDPTYAIVICHYMDELYVRFLVDKKWVDEKRCFFSQPVPGTLQKHTDLRLKTYKWELQSTRCLQTQEIKDELDKLKQNIENNKPYKMQDDHPIALAIKAALRAYPDQMSSLFNTSYQEEIVKLYIEEQNSTTLTDNRNDPTISAMMTDKRAIEESQTPATSTEPAAEPVAKLPAETVTTKSDRLTIESLIPAIDEILQTDSTPVTTAEPLLEKPLQDAQPLKKMLSKTAIVEQNNEPQEKQVTLPTMTAELAIVQEKSPKKADFDFILELKNILVAAERQHQQEFLRHTGLRKMHAILSSVDENNISHSYLLLKKEAISRSTGFRNWLSNTSFFCMSQGRDPAVHALYQSIKKISFDKRNNDNNKIMLNNLRQTLMQCENNTKTLNKL